MATHSATVSTVSLADTSAPFPPVKKQFNLFIAGLRNESTGGVVGFNYRMRGFDTNGSVNSLVYWSSTEVDSDASDYTGSAGPVTNIVIQRIVTA